MTPPETLPERCDRCPATARVRAELPFGELHFCAHHARAHEDRLRAMGARLRTPANAPPLPPVRSRRDREPAAPG
ncbi:DUF7455 domain-containing protein [Pseudonocardia sichuanensis]|uniref:DUF7455 domain-containing protein n=1 Tax=Pseudonocardia kunmingensis TaxID=630975 RepID=A0A543CZF7_9PSEU|nr:hypothetical protein [Pseudonocardia kunmingensis]TQM02278.1 hypothetical protein FB558_8144 [Pseudonocardia kunmingensis]